MDLQTEAEVQPNAMDTYAIPSIRTLTADLAAGRKNLDDSDSQINRRKHSLLSFSNYQGPSKKAKPKPADQKVSKSKHLGLTASSKWDPTTRSKPTSSKESSCAFLAKLPIEIRIMVYQELLISASPIQDAHELFGPKKSFMKYDDKPRIPNLDSRVLRTCKQIYNEARPILYGENWFRFVRLYNISAFARDGSPDDLLTYNFKLSKHGRLTKIKKLSLSLDLPFSRYSSRQESMDHWSDWFLTPGYKMRGLRPIPFPSLERLHLGFSGWNLTAEEKDAMIVSPFINTLSVPGGLLELSVQGVTHKQNLCDLMHGLLRRGGKFLALDRQGNVVMDVVVADKDHEAS